MTNHSDDPTWPATALADQMQQAGEQAMNQQLALFRKFLSANSATGLEEYSRLGAMSNTTAVFKTRVQSGGRISIPDAEREALGIEEGDIVQTIVIPLTNSGDTNE